MTRIKDQLLALAETESEARLLERWLGVQDRQLTARSCAWEEVRARRRADRGADSAARDLGRFAVRAIYA